MARLLGASTVETRAIERFAASVARETDVARILVAEARGAALYWTLWNDLPVRFARQNPDRIGPDGRWQPGRRDPWHTFGPRASLLTGQPYRATTPGNAVLNWLYAVCQIELTIALLAVGVDPGVGLFHVDMVNRPSLTLDAIEALRPYVDHWLASYLAGTVFANRDFTELRDGEVRLTHPLNAHLAHTAALWRKLAEPVADWLRDAFLRAVYARLGRIAGDRVPRLPPLAPLLPPLTRTRAAWPAVETVPSACRECGRALPRSPTASRRRVYCSRSCAADNRRRDGAQSRPERTDRVRSRTDDGQIPTKVRKVPQKGPSNAKPFGLRFKLASSLQPHRRLFLLTFVPAAYSPGSCRKAYPKAFWHRGAPCSPRASRKFGLTYQGS